MPRKSKTTQTVEELAPFVIPAEPLACDADLTAPGPYMTDEAQTALLCGTIEQAWVNRLMHAPLAEVIEACDLETDVARLGEASMLCDGELKDQIEQRIAVILRAAPIDGRCLAESEERLECELPDDQIVVELRKQLEIRKEAEAILEAAKSQAKYAKGTIEAADKAIDDAGSGKVWRTVAVQKLLVGDQVVQVRMDTGEQMWAREATATELQEPIPFDEPQGNDIDTSEDA